MTRRIWLIAGAVGVMLLIAALATAPRLLRRLAFFRIREVEVVGLSYLDEGEVVRRLGLRPDASIFDPLDAPRRAARVIPGVLGATVDRRFPGTLRITITEAVPVALTPGPEHLALLDAHGRVLPFDPARAPASLPIADGDSTVAGLLARVMSADPLWYGSIETVRTDRGDVVFDDATHRVRMRPDADGDEVRAVTAVRAYLESRGVAWREIDARYHDRVFVRKGKGAA